MTMISSLSYLSKYNIMSKYTHLISIDYGTHKSWLAYSVKDFCFAHKTLPTRDLSAYLRDWIIERDATEIIIWLPLNIDNTESKHSKKVRKYAQELKKIFPDISIILHDERLTTSEAELSWVEDIDAESARLILESYMTSKN